MQTSDGICPTIYQWFFDDTIQHIPESDRAGHIMCDELQLKSGIYWNMLSHKLVGFASDKSEMNLAKEIKAINNAVHEETDADCNSAQSSDSFDLNNANAKKVNQWRFRSIKGIIHNAKYFFNSGSLTGDELLRQFTHVVSCYESIGVRILGCVCDAGGQNSRLFHYLCCSTPIDDNAWLSNNCVLVTNPAIPSRKIALWFCSMHQLKNMHNALLNTNSMSSKCSFVHENAPISWQFLEDRFKADCRRSSPLTHLTKTSVYPDGWNKMNVSAAKAPFSYETISDMMLNVATELQCTDEIYMIDIGNMDIPTLYKSRLSVLLTYNKHFGNAVLASKIRTIEYSMHIAIIFNETLLNSKVFINQNTLLKHETNLCYSLQYFECWNKHCVSHKQTDNFLLQITYNNLCMTVCGFMTYARLVVEDNAFYPHTTIFVPALHSNTSTLESWFSLMHSMHKDSTCT